MYQYAFLASKCIFEDIKIFLIQHHKLTNFDSFFNFLLYYWGSYELSLMHDSRKLSLHTFLKSIHPAHGLVKFLNFEGIILNIFLLSLFFF